MSCFLFLGSSQRHLLREEMLWGECPSGFSDAVRRQRVPGSGLDRNQALSNLICIVMVTGWMVMVMGPCRKEDTWKP